MKSLRQSSDREVLFELQKTCNKIIKNGILHKRKESILSTFSIPFVVLKNMNFLLDTS